MNQTSPKEWRSIMRARIWNITMFVIFLTVNLYPADKADFSGEWVFNQGKSILDDFGTGFLPTRMAVIQSGNDLTVQKNIESEYDADLVLEDKLTLDGKECKSEFMNSPRTAAANWSVNGDTLFIHTKISFQREGESSEMTLDEAWSLTDGGKVLSVKHASSSSWGERKITMVFDKKEAPKDIQKEEVK